MKSRIGYLATGLFALTLIGCSAGPQAIPGPEQQRESAMEKRQRLCPWCMNEPEVEGSNMHFVGISKVYAAEQGARTDAMRNATRAVVLYIGSTMKVKMEEARVSHGLSSDAIDPVGVTREFERQLARSIVNRQKAIKWYVEREDTATGRGYKYFVLTRIAKQSIDNPFQEFAKQKKKEAAAKARQQKTEDQSAAAAKMWDDLMKQGVVE